APSVKKHHAKQVRRNRAASPPCQRRHFGVPAGKAIVMRRLDPVQRVPQPVEQKNAPQLIALQVIEDKTWTARRHDQISSIGCQEPQGKEKSVIPELLVALL